MSKYDDDIGWIMEISTDIGGEPGCWEALFCLILPSCPRCGAKEGDECPHPTVRDRQQAAVREAIESAE